MQELRCRWISWGRGRCSAGFANRTLGYRLPDKNRVEGAALRGRLQTLGILREVGDRYPYRYSTNS